ncbi:hypothetical protein BCV71DRAFT_292177 [Rhizopus microsporus]|uniref:Tc1-like transposase DDE domain-containing protein n=1 Tax=Rhizopus microsporus TaxID=58291 RepID=A0A1X0RWR4_RHIZD|nr:hypothetical protein BCV71DRAFT_292177 [Rhizopus microsporus]
MEGILSDVINPNIILEYVTSREKYLSGKRSEKMIEEVSIKNQPRAEKPKQASSYNNYSDFTTETFIDRMFEQPVKRDVVSKVARDLNINYHTAVGWWHLHNETEDIAYKKSEQNNGPKKLIYDCTQRARSKSGSTAIVKQPKARSSSHTVIGAIHSSTVMHIVMKKPLSRRETESAKKKRKSNSGKKRAAAEIDKADMSTENNDMSNKPVAKGTTTAHFVKFINDLLDIMDMDDGMKGRYLVLDNKSKLMIHKIESRGYRAMYLPPYSPELNPIEQFWAIIKGKIKRDRLMTEKIYLVELQMPGQIINCFNKAPF